MAYSLAFRIKALESHDNQCDSQLETAEYQGISLSTLKRIKVSF